LNLDQKKSPGKKYLKSNRGKKVEKGQAKIFSQGLNLFEKKGIKRIDSNERNLRQ
jgi:hypothetical protein